MYPTHKQVEVMKKRYPKGSRVELIKMEDPYAPPKGTQGTVTWVRYLCIGTTVQH